MKKALAILLLFFIIASCNNSTNVSNEEYRVINDIFFQIPDKIDFYLLYPPYPSPPVRIKDENGNSSSIDSAELKRQMAEYRKAVEEIKLDTHEVILAVYDTLIDDFCNPNELEPFLDDPSLAEYHSILKSNISQNKNAEILSLDKIKNTGKYRLRYFSDFPEANKIFRSNYDFRFGGLLVFSRIYFSENKEKAILYCNYRCGGNCGSGNLLFLRKQKTGWVVDDIRNLWVY